MALLMTAVLLGGFSNPASAADGRAPSTVGAEDGQTTTVRGVLQNRADGGSTPVEGATVTVTTGGAEVEATSDAQGRFEAEIPFVAGQQVEVALDEGSLPDGVALREGQSATRTLTMSNTLGLRVNFLLGAGNSQAASGLSELPQVIYNGVYFGVILALGALGLSMIFGTTGLTNFAHGELVTFGAIMTYTFNVTAGLSIWISALLAIILSGAFGWLQDTVFWRRLRRRGTGLIAMMIVSIGLQFLLRNVFQFFTGGRTSNYREYSTPEGISAGPITYTIRDLVCLAIAIVLLLGVTFALQRTRIGRATRAIADNPALAASTGINVDRVITVVWTVGAGLAGTCGVLLGFTQSVKFDLGAQILLVMFAAITVGGLGSIWGAIIGSLIVGVLIELSTLVIPSELKIAAALFLLIIILLVRPQGLLGRRERIG
ncbi:branched-chain amino acid ABC transporter permease [Solicola sp. PLA-1-18]|uniref:branched-chain amino acid ABC transporter permease n=1 Tax=Solicola sp. PLA-1-18 TaxID=3380532 RepID=UPI003B7B326B